MTSILPKRKTTESNLEAKIKGMLYSKKSSRLSPINWNSPEPTR